MPRELTSLEYGADTVQSRSRLQELILYVSGQCVDDPDFGAVKLNKVLWFADSFAYRRLGRSITGCQYQKLDYGPAPKHLIPAMEGLGDAIEIRFIPGFRYTRKKPVPRRNPDLSMFSLEEIAIVDEVIQEVESMTARQLSDLSHGFAWQIAESGGLISYNASLLANDQSVTEIDVARASELAKTLPVS